MNMLKDITARRDPCKRTQDGPGKLRFFLAITKVILNESLLVNIMVFDVDLTSQTVGSSKKILVAEVLSEINI